MKKKRLYGAFALGFVLLQCAAAVADAPSDTMARGRYLVAVGGCNDCHTSGYAESGGRIPEREWLMGSPVGFQGPWGTTYAANLRTAAADMSEAAWLVRARSTLRPPMPGTSLQVMTDKDLRAIYRFIRGLGARGEAAPAYVPPGGVVTTPVIDFVPRTAQALVARP
jgi:mono/diheme cytochrome c family protein